MAAKYRKFDPRFWRDEKIVALSPIEKAVAVYMMTAQTNRCGIFTFSVAMAAEETGIDADSYRVAMRRVCSALNWSFEEATRVLYLPTWWKYNPPENPKHLKGCLQDLHDLPQTSLLSLFFQNEKHLPEHCRETFRIAMPIAMRIPTGIARPYQEQEQEQEQKQEIPPNPRKRGKRRSKASADEYPGFTRYVAAFPGGHKDGKSHALKLWIEKGLEIQTDTVLAGLEAWKRSARWAEGFIPSLKNFLADDKWTDTPPVNGNHAGNGHATASGGVPDLIGNKAAIAAALNRVAALNGGAD